MATTLRQPLQALSLSPSGSLLAVAYGGVVQLVDVQSGELLASSSPEDSHKILNLQQAPAGCLVRHFVWHTDEKLVSSGEDKVVKEWAIENSDMSTKLVLKQEREIPKRANAISITHDGQTLVVADKFGDVYAFAMSGCNPSLPSPPVAKFFEASSGDPAVEAGPSGSAVNSSAGAEAESVEASDAAPKRNPQTFKPTDGQRRGTGKAPDWRHVPARISALTPVLGHVSMLTALLLFPGLGASRSNSTARIITADRDEHIRVSQWPEGWKVERFLLGQKKFVSSLAIHPTDSNLLISAGGDDTLRIWDLTTYKCIDKVSFSLDQLKGTAEVQVEIAPPAPGKRTKRRRNKAATRVKNERAAQGGAPAAIEAEEENEEAAEEEEEANPTAELEKTWKAKTKTKKLDLAITKMAFVAGPSGKAEDGLLVLSSVGSSALLAFPTKSFTELGKPAPQSQLVKLQHPILDFTANETSPMVLVSLDVTMPADVAERGNAVQALSVNAEGQLDVSSHTALEVLNTKCSKEISDAEPYPSLLALYPDMALLSKDPSDEHS